MAVVDPNVNIAPSYEAIQRALQDRARIESESGGDGAAGIANAIVSPFAQQAQAMQKQQAELTKQRQEKIFDLAKNTQQLDIPDGATLDDVVSGRVSPALKPKFHTVTQDDINQFVKDHAVDPDHAGAFQDFLGQTLDPKALDAALQKRVEFIHSSTTDKLDHDEFETQNPDGTWVPVKGWADKTKMKYFNSKGQEITGPIRPLDKGQAARDDKNDHFDEDKIQQFEKRIDTTQKRAGSLADAQKRLNGIQRLDALFKGYADDLTPQEWEEAAISWASILGSGTGVNSREQVQALVPESARGSVKKEMQWFLNKPTGTDQQAFAKRIQQGMSREQDVNTSIIKESQLRGLGSVQDVAERKPERIRTMLDNYGLKPEDVIKSYPKLAPKLYPELGPFYGSEAEAHAALVSGKIQPGQKITINGRQAIIN